MIRDLVRQGYWFLSQQVGVDLRRTYRCVRGIPRYAVTLWRFATAYRRRFSLRPCLQDWYEEGGEVRNEYFIQDLYVARQVYAARPRRHVDVGSRIDGFVAHVASFRQVEVFDVRPVSTAIPGILFRQADVSRPLPAYGEYCDSLSCLHALEHFGLGRYGDPVDPEAWLRGLETMTAMLQDQGTFYLAVPVGRERVEFNAQRVFDPQSLLETCKGMGLSLRTFAWIEDGWRLMSAAEEDIDFARLRDRRYALAIYTFRKNRLLP